VSSISQRATSSQQNSRISIVKIRYQETTVEETGGWRSVKCGDSAAIMYSFE
jgi:hypothetical protein